MTFDNPDGYIPVTQEDLDEVPEQSDPIDAYFTLVDKDKLADLRDHLETMEVDICTQSQGLYCMYRDVQRMKGLINQMLIKE